MTNLITHEYSIWLDNFCKTSTPHSSTQQAMRIKTQLGKAQSLNDVIDVLTKNIPSKHNDFSSESAPSYQPISLYCKLMEWKSALEERKAKFEEVKISSTILNAPLQPKH